jgi:hypothetical protein
MKKNNSLTLFSLFLVVWWLTVFARILTFRQVHKVQPRVAKGRAARARPLVHHAKLPDQRRNGMLAAARVGHREGAILRHSDGPPLEDCCYVSFVRGAKKEKNTLTFLCVVVHLVFLLRPFCYFVHFISAISLLNRASYEDLFF